MVGWPSVHFICTSLPPAAATPTHQYPRLRFPCPAATAPAPAAAAAAPILGGGGSGEEGPGKPLLGKKPHSEGIRTKRDLQHDHHLNRKGKGGWAFVRVETRNTCQENIEWDGLGCVGLGWGLDGTGLGGTRQEVWVCACQTCSTQQALQRAAPGGGTRSLSHPAGLSVPPHPPICLPAGTGRTKKSGAGGKYTWGAAMSGTERDEAALDPNDPNYDSGALRMLCTLHMPSCFLPAVWCAPQALPAACMPPACRPQHSQAACLTPTPLPARLPARLRAILLQATMPAAPFPSTRSGQPRLRCSSARWPCCWRSTTTAGT